MKILLLITLLTSVSKIYDLEVLLLKPSDINGKVVIGDENYTNSYDVWSLYNGISVYQFPKIKGKSFQSFKMGKSEGNVFFIVFEDKIADGSEVLVERIIWNNKGERSKRYPAKYIIKDNALIIIYFKWGDGLGVEIEGALKRKLEL